MPHEDEDRHSGDGLSQEATKVVGLPVDILGEARRRLSLTASEETSFAHTLILDF